MSVVRFSRRVHPQRSKAVDDRGRAVRAGDLLRVKGSKRLWVALPVSRQDLRRGMNTTHTGLHLFGGYWYAGGPLSSKAYGKIIEVEGVVVDRLHSSYMARRHCR